MAAVKTTSELTEDEVEDYREAFNNFDKDGDGSIDEAELGIVMRSLGYSPTNQQLKEMMAKVCHTYQIQNWVIILLLVFYIVLHSRRRNG